MLLALTWAGATASAQAPAKSAVVPPADGRYPVILSSRWFHPSSPQDTLSTLAVVDQYQPDRIDWMYCTNDAQLAQLRARHLPYSLALNPQVPDSVEYTVRGRIVDLDEKKLVAPWMRNWNQKNAHWGCVNSPEFKAVFYAHSRRLLDLGAYGLFVDDARFNDHAVEWGGCFCDHCMNGFTRSLRTSETDTLRADFNYRDYLRQASGAARQPSAALAKAFRAFQTASVVRFLTAWRTAMQTHAARPVTFLTNNYGGRWNAIYGVFDVGIGELPPEQLNTAFIKARVAEAEKLGKKQFFTLTSDDENQQLLALFHTYAAGSALVIPWDVYVPARTSVARPRFFGSARTFSPTYKLFRQSSSGLAKQTRASRNARQGSVTGHLEPVTSNDSLLVFEYPSTESGLVLLESKNSRATNEIILKSAASGGPDSLRVVYPTRNVHISREGNNLRISYPTKALVLSFPQP